MTQEEMLLEAAETEIINLRNLERVLAREEEVKKKAVVHKAVYEGPTIRFCSRDGNFSIKISSSICLHLECGITSFFFLHYEL
jgi:vacuolar protein sorting-associated protein 72